MNLRPRAIEQPEVGLTPLIDVVFLLLIFFMVSTTFRKEAEIQIDLPEASQEPIQSEQQSLTVAIAADGTYAVNNQILPDQSPETLQATLLQIAGDDRQIPFVIRADARATHQAVITAMDIAGRLGFIRLSIATIRPED